MPRIIAGQAGGLQLSSVPGDGTRPTTDRTREALFSWLAARGWLEETAVVDLFAGSGALGGEAASRGAARVLLVERDRRAAGVCRKNAAAVNHRLGRDVVQVAVGAVDQVLSGPAGAGPWDLVLADPPYPLEGPALTATLERIAAVMAPGGLLVLERSVRSVEPEWPAGIEVLEARTYGETVLYYCLGPDDTASGDPDAGAGDGAGHSAG
ncbi:MULTISPECIES: 16S rRNA (guanine(966)-N(2))-methyltransferase RsmD [Micrococcaceae]|uniref:16S rRNA (guanine(966)-N(2))-methyltransferase RsmD n=1 Tax=Micrococcaceae TaxID=1268 RepID=UPI00161CD03F|nr:MULTISPECIES: 16S rRNA (guanine(966)-N(2))-methyltransferase RsmD [Micrococcaceae]MBB5748444.1 16S rRNA (guanine966-N2)-methyltransferase [Micrococcus sp. TA1]HRO30956.1 16S rRNA (guanine(966)-N(2))-methyltransferase RsmD [Citricoccus sp.]HRO93625.1 16S rRNA (guanine(966)-N(2))-methyltransferase RsmD [Citricoccus sp.]